ncbi:hypothetical protein [Saccharothrix deserti]|uniref:hypothetical protein n=1 Tax=Saccharothrix deserti TaxID=2593674 RepID=UPI00131A77CF|nr:hypothetical protein [Saccharothrix deserti]
MSTLTTSRSCAEVLATATDREVTAALYLSPDYEPGDLYRTCLEVVEVWAVVGIDDLTPDLVDRVHAEFTDPARLIDCRVTARAILAAQ